MRTRAILPLIALAAAPLAAQSPADREALEGFRDSLAVVTDSASLLRLESATIAVAKEHRDSVLLHLRLGWLAIRLGELAGSGSHYEDAAGEFEWAGELAPDWPYAWWGLGLAEYARGEHRAIAIENLRQQLGMDYLAKSARAFARALQADPTFVPAALDLANTTLVQHIRPQLEVAVQALRAAASAPGAPPEVHLVHGRLEEEVGEADSAVAAFHAAIAAGGDSGICLLELARAQYFADRPAAGQSAYFAGARAAVTPGSIALYRRDVGYVASPAELAALDNVADAASRAAWLERFWTGRDVAQARESGERMAEHFRRWLVARRQFRIVSRHRHYDITEVYRSDQAEFDDRGLVYLRHGEPDRRTTYPSDVTSHKPEPNESWLYRRPGGDVVFHFVARDDATDFKLVESLIDAMGFRAAVNASGGVDDPVTRALYASREDFGPVYVRVANGQSLVMPALEDERRAGRAAIVAGTTTDSYSRRFAEALEPVVSDFVAGTATGGQALHVLFAIAGDRLAPTPAGGGVAYPLRFRLLVSDLRDSLIARLDTLRVFTAPHALRSPDYLAGRLALAVPAGTWRYRLLVSTLDGAAGQLVFRDSLTVDPLDGRRFAASDLVVGRVGSGLVWAHGRDTVLLDPLGWLPRTGVAELYFEVYGLGAGAPYHTVIRLEPETPRRFLGLFGRKKPPVLLEFDAPADGPRTLVHRGIDLRTVSPGRYRLAVTLTDPTTQRTLTRTARLEVVDRQESRAER